MNNLSFTFCDTALVALPSGALLVPAAGVLCVSDLHLGKADRIARRSGRMLPPYEVQETLGKLEADILETAPGTVICLGDSFDDLAAAHDLAENMRLWLTGLQAGRRWVWIEGNHDPGPVDLGGSHVRELRVGALVFRHIASGGRGEVSGHYHPKHSIAGRSRPAFLFDDQRLIMPAYGTYTGGLHSQSADLRRLFSAPPMAILTGRKAIAVPT
ncbi:ligase-associated DNA damage response endonuclease PdeM [Yoonia sp.]|uniref:ligase-associated DNA damage response endonuclease PdeM n=1 Tax=Yoonia sp. TaxID=2212373 RepID=UPI002FD89F22